jgi:flagellar hook assembly protein FlgD
VHAVQVVLLYDARGALVATLVNNESRDAGAYRLEWNGHADSGAAVSSGIYFARISHNDAVQSRKMVLLK